MRLSDSWIGQNEHRSFVLHPPKSPRLPSATPQSARSAPKESRSPESFFVATSPRNDSSPDRSVALSASTALHVSEYHLQLWSTSVMGAPFCLRWVIAEKAPYTSRDSSAAPTGETRSSHADRIPRSALPPAEEKDQMPCCPPPHFREKLLPPSVDGERRGQIVPSGIYGHRLQFIPRILSVPQAGHLGQG